MSCIIETMDKHIVSEGISTLESFFGLTIQLFRIRLLHHQYSIIYQQNSCETTIHAMLVKYGGNNSN